jgi:hypothetical protein
VVPWSGTPKRVGAVDGAPLSMMGFGKSFPVPRGASKKEPPSPNPLLVPPLPLPLELGIELPLELDELRASPVALASSGPPSGENPDRLFDEPHAWETTAVRRMVLRANNEREAGMMDP